MEGSLSSQCSLRLLLLFTSVLLCPTAVVAGEFRAYNDSGCTAPLSTWTVSEPQLNYTAHNGACYNVSNVAGAASLLYTCAVTATPSLPDYVFFFYLAYALPSCAGEPVRSVYLPPVNLSSRVSGGPEQACLVFGLADESLNYTHRYGIVSCAATATSRAVRGARCGAVCWLSLLVAVLTALTL